MVNKVTKSADEWRAELSSEEFAVCREHGTERPFTGEYVSCKEAGTYHCTCCGALLFDAKHKFDSGTGWPSFWELAEAENVTTKEDSSYGMRRVEALCNVCDAHLGHVFPDGPAPTNLRYCINSVSIKLQPEKK